MRIVELVPISTIQAHLAAQATGVSLNIHEMPGRPDEYIGCRVLLDAADAEKLLLWFEFRKHTLNQSCRLKDLTESIRGEKKFRRFHNGDPAKGWPPGDLRITPNCEPTIVTDRVDSDVLYLIDGNNRCCAQYLRVREFQDVPALVAMHPKMLQWAYIPTPHKKFERPEP